MSVRVTLVYQHLGETAGSASQYYSVQQRFGLPHGRWGDAVAIISNRGLKKSLTRHRIQIATHSHRAKSVGPACRAGPLNPAVSFFAATFNMGVPAIQTLRSRPAFAEPSRVAGGTYYRRRCDHFTVILSRILKIGPLSRLLLG